MDPLSQGVLGAVVPQCIARKEEFHVVSIAGFLAGMLADIDVFIRSPEDTLLAIEYHRHFTHSLLFIPFGGLISAICLWFFMKKKISFSRLSLMTTLGYGTAGLLDACTSYGTRLFWPFSEVRVAWNNIAVIDLFFTLPLCVTVFYASKKRSTRIAQIGLTVALIYLLFGVFQRERAEKVLMDLAEKRGHHVERLTVKPTIGNLILWRGIYESDGQFYVDAVRVGFSSQVYEGNSCEKVILEKHFEGLSPETLLYSDLKRFQHFSDDYLFYHPSLPNTLGDLRYSLLPHELEPLWGITIDLKATDKHVYFQHYRQITRSAWKRYWTLLKGSPLGE